MTRRFTPFLATLSVLVSAAILHAEPVRIHTLDNGLTVILKEEHKAPVVSFQVWYGVGSRNEVTGKTGLTHLLEHLMFKGSEHYDKGEFSRIVARYGGTENAFTYRDYTAYFTNWAPQHLPLSLAMEADRMANLTLDPEEFTPELEVVREERRLRIDDNPIYATIEQMYAAAYMAHPYGQPVIGWMNDLKHLTRDDAYRHYLAYYAPNNATIVAVGDFDSADLLRRIRETFGPIPRSNAIPPLTVREPPQEGERRIILRRPAQLPFVFLGYHTPNWASEDSLPLVVLANILFEGKSSRMFQRLMYRDQIAVDGGGEYDPLTTDPELFYFYAIVAPDHSADEVEAAIYEEVERLASEPPEERELTRAKNQIEADFLMNQDSVYTQAMQLGHAATVGAGPDYVTTFPERVRKVTGEDVMRVAKAYLTADNRTVAVLTPKMAEPATPGKEGE